MEIEDESDFAVPLVPPDPRTSTPRAINNNAQCNLPAQLDASPVQAVVQGGGDQVQPEAEQAPQLSVNLEDLCLLCSEEIQDKGEQISTIDIKEDISVIYR